MTTRDGFEVAAASVIDPPHDEAALQESSGTTAQSAEDILMSALTGRSKTLVCTARKGTDHASAESVLPSQRHQVLRVLATLVVLSPDYDRQGYSLPQMLSFGLALFPGSHLFQEEDAGIVVPTTRILAAKIAGKDSSSLQSVGYIQCMHPLQAGPGVVPGKARTRVRVLLTPKGALIALEDGWRPPPALHMQTLLRRAERAITFGVYRIA